MTIEQQLRLEALRVAAGYGVDADQTLKNAERIYQWLIDGLVSKGVDQR